ncbi:Mbeg1-like protein [Alloscardovia venturai]|uniref:Mbeg1-like protein n=1 Tax=Alloscardovia venturai TaxID=1769421 RepID=A0ABW2Y5T3_9BIFI
MTRESERDNREIANLEYYGNLDSPDKKEYDYVTTHGTNLGKVVDSIHDPNTGLDAWVLKKDRHLTVIYRGSTNPLAVNNDSAKDWNQNDIPMATRIVSGSHTPTPQLVKASEFLNKTLRKNEGCDVSVYGHSLGSMDAQYALANLDSSHVSRVKSAHVYEGPNIYNILTDKQRETAFKLRTRINNYVDPKDVIATGYTFDYNAVGKVRHLSTTLQLDYVHFDQHMMKGYQFQKDGDLEEWKQNSNNLHDAVTHFMHKHPKLAHSKYGKLYIDYMETSYLTSSMTIAASEAETTIEKKISAQRAQLSSEVSDFLQSIHLNLPNLTDDEIHSAIVDAKATQQDLVNTFNQSAQTLLDATRALSDSFAQFETRMAAELEKAAQTDAELARRVVEWNDETSTDKELENAKAQSSMLRAPQY